MTFWDPNDEAAWRPHQELHRHYSDRQLGLRGHYLFEYDPASGALFSRFSERLATYQGSTGHKIVRLDNRTASAAAVVWCMHHFDKFGVYQIRHVNKLGSDTRIANLRCGNSEVMVHAEGFVARAVLPGHAPHWLGPFGTRDEATTALAQYERANIGKEPALLQLPDIVMDDLNAISQPHRQYVHGVSYVPEGLAYLIPSLPPLPKRVEPTPRHNVDDLV